MRKTERGQSLFELVVAIAISALVIVAIVSLASTSIRNATFSKNNAIAVSYAQSATEWLRMQRDTDINTFMTNVATAVWCFNDPTPTWSDPGACAPGSTIAGTPFSREGHFTITSPGGKTLIQTDMVVIWTDSQGDHEVTSSTNFTDWRQR